MHSHYRESHIGKGHEYRDQFVRGPYRSVIREIEQAQLLEILALASRAFAFYYMLQCLVAISVSKSPVERTGMAVVAAALGFITVFAVPAS
jgi:hypothetical protein